MLFYIIYDFLKERKKIFFPSYFIRFPNFYGYVSKRDMWGERGRDAKIKRFQNLSSQRTFDEDGAHDFSLKKEPKRSYKNLHLLLERYLHKLLYTKRKRENQIVTKVLRSKQQKINLNL